MALKPIINFSSGEASPKLRGRADTVPYNTAAETLENVLVTRYGSAFRTPGRRYVAQARGSSVGGVIRSVGADINTTHAESSLADISGSEIELTLIGTSHIVAYASLQTQAASSSITFFLTINIDGVDSPIIEREHSNASDKGNVTITYRTPTALAAGTYTIKLRAYSDSGDIMTLSQGKLVAIACEDALGNTIPSAYDTVASDTTTSATIEDIDGLTQSLTLAETSHIFGAMAISTSVSGANITIDSTINLAGDQDTLSRKHSAASDKGSVCNTGRTITAVTGAQTVKGEWLTDSGTATGAPCILTALGMEVNGADNKTIPSATVSGVTDSTSSTSLVDITGANVDISLNQSAKVFVALSLDSEIGTNNIDGSFAIFINGVSQGVYTRRHGTASDRGSDTIFALSDTLPAGTYSVEAKFYTAANTITVRNASLTAIGLEADEINPSPSTGNRLIPFIFSTGNAYVLLFSNLFMRVFQSNGSVVETSTTITGITQANPAVVTSTAHGYSDGDYIDITGVSGMTEINGKRYIVANSAANTYELTDEDGLDVDSTGFTAYTSGGIAERVYEIATPFMTENLPNLKWTQQADTMYIASADKPLQKLLRTGTTSWSIADIVYDTIAYPPFLEINVTSTTITPSATTGSGITLTASTSIFEAGHVGSYWQLDHSGTKGYAKITGYTSGTQVTADVVVDFGGTGATDNWYEGAWSEVQGYPIDVKFHQDRLVALGTASRPLTIWHSVIGEYDNFNTQVGGTLADTDGYSVTINAAQIDRILWGYPTDIMNIGTAGGPFTLDVSSATDINQGKFQNENGSADVSPVRIGSFVYYIERSGQIVSEFKYNFELDIFQSEDITYLNDHILDSGVKEMTIQRYPDQILWCVKDNGGVATLTREIQQQVKGWTRQEFAGTDAEVENIAAIPNGEEDQVWFVVKRTIDGITRRYVEYMESFEQDTQADQFFVDSGLTYSGAAVTTLSNLDHLEGEAVAILANGAVHPNRTVTDGQITLDYEVTKAQVGLPYTSTIKTMDVELATEIGSAQARVKQISKVYVRILESLGMLVGDVTIQDPIPFRDSSMSMNEPPSLFSGDKEVVFPAGADENKFVVVKQEQPLPLHVLGVYLKMLVSTGGAPS